MHVAGNGLPRHRAQPVRARAHHEGERRRRRSRTQTSSRRGRATTSPTSGQGSLPCAWLPTEDTNAPEHKPVAIDKARYVGDAVAVIAATSRGAAEDAAELVEVDYEPLPAVVDVEAALAEGAPLVHEEFGTNRCYTWTLEAGEVDRLFAEAAVTVTRALPPEPADPERDRAARRVRHAGPGDGRVHALVDDAGAAHRARHAQRRHRASPRRSCA